MEGDLTALPLPLPAGWALGGTTCGRPLPAWHARRAGRRGGGSLLRPRRPCARPSGAPRSRRRSRARGRPRDARRASGPRRRRNGHAHGRDPVRVGLPRAARRPRARAGAGGTPHAALGGCATGRVGGRDGGHGRARRRTGDARRGARAAVAALELAQRRRQVDPAPAGDAQPRARSPARARADRAHGPGRPGDHGRGGPRSAHARPDGPWQRGPAHALAARRGGRARRPCGGGHRRPGDVRRSSAARVAARARGLPAPARASTGAHRNPGRPRARRSRRAPRGERPVRRWRRAGLGIGAHHGAGARGHAAPDHGQAGLSRVPAGSALAPEPRSRSLGPSGTAPAHGQRRRRARCLRSGDGGRTGAARSDAAQASPALRSVGLDVRLRLQGPVLVRSAFGRLEATGEIAARGDLAEPAPFGRLTVREGGKLNVQGREFTVTQGSLVYSGDWNPALRLEAQAQVREESQDYHRDYQVRTPCRGRSTRRRSRSRPIPRCPSRRSRA